MTRFVRRHPGTSPRTGGAAAFLASVSAVLLLIGAGSAAASHTAAYSVVDLGTLGGDAIGQAINNRGEVVGCAAVSGGTCDRAILYQNGRVSDLGTLPGGAFSLGADINDKGDVVGTSATPESPFLPLGHAFLISAGKLTDLGTLGGSWSQAFAVNDKTVVVGLAYTRENNLHAFLYDDGTMVDINPPGSALSLASDISNSGNAVGSGTFPAGLRGFIWRDGVATVLGTLGGTQSEANAVNERGEVVGGANLPADRSFHAFLYRREEMLDLGSLGGVDGISEARAINSRGDVVGLSGTSPGESPLHAFLWDGVRMLDLNDLIPADSGWTLAWATGINDRGQITGFGTHNGLRRPFLLTPSTRK